MKREMEQGVRGRVDKRRQGRIATGLGLPVAQDNAMMQHIGPATARIGGDPRQHSRQRLHRTRLIPPSHWPARDIPRRPAIRRPRLPSTQARVEPGSPPPSDPSTPPAKDAPRAAAGFALHPLKPPPAYDRLVDAAADFHPILTIARLRVDHGGRRVLENLNLFLPPATTLAPMKFA